MRCFVIATPKIILSVQYDIFSVSIVYLDFRFFLCNYSFMCIKLIEYFNVCQNPPKKATFLLLLRKTFLCVFRQYLWYWNKCKKKKEKEEKNHKKYHKAK